MGDQGHISRLVVISLCHILGDRLTVHQKGGVHIDHLGEGVLLRRSRVSGRLLGCCLNRRGLLGSGSVLIHKGGGVLLHASAHKEKQGKRAHHQRKQLSCHCLHSYGYKIMSTKVTAKATVCYFCNHIVTNSSRQNKGNFHYTLPEILVYFFSTYRNLFFFSGNLTFSPEKRSRKIDKSSLPLSASQPARKRAPFPGGKFLLAILSELCYSRQVVTRRCSSMAECQLPKLNTGVRFPSPAPKRKDIRKDVLSFWGPPPKGRLHPSVIAMHGQNKFALRQDFRHRRKCLYGAKAPRPRRAVGWSSG